MNILIVSDKSEIKNYESIVKAAPNTSVLGAVTTLNNDFITDIKEKYHPHALVIDTSVPVKKTNVYDVISAVHGMYPYIKIVVLTDEYDKADYSAFAVIRGQITNVEFNNIIKQAQDDIENADFQLLSDKVDSNRLEEVHTNVATDFNGTGKTTKLYPPPSDNNVDNLSNLKIKITNIKPNKNKKGYLHNDKMPIIIAITAVSVIAVVITILICLKSCNSNASVASKDEVSNSTVTTGSITSQPPTEEELIISFTDSPSSPTVESAETTLSDKKTEKSESEAPKVDTKKENSSSKISSSGNSSKSSSSSKVISSSNSSQSSNKSETSISYDNDRYNNSGNDDVNSISLSYNSKTLKVGDYINLKATTYPITKSVSWSSSNTYVATVNSSGKVTAKNVGTAIITASVDGIKAKCKITVNSKPTVAPTTKDSVKLSVSSHNIVIGQIINITLDGSSGCSWKISNPSVVQICGGGSNKITVKGIKSGNTTVTATNNATGNTYTCKITVN